MNNDTSKALPRREEIAKEHQWELGDIYTSLALWEADFQRLKELVGEIQKHQDHVTDSANTLLRVLTLRDEIGRLLDKLFVFARMHKDEDNANPEYQSLTDRIQGLASEVGGALAFIVPSLVELPLERLTTFLAENSELRVYQHFFAEIERQRQHILSTPEERILAENAELADAASTIFTMFDNADLKFPSLRNEKGELVELTKGRYSKFVESKDRRVRREAFTLLHETYQKFSNTLAATLNANVKADIFYARMRRFNSAIEASLDNDNIPITVYERLIETVHSYLPVLNRYLRLRKKLLDLPDLHMYDLYTSLMPEYQRSVDFETAKEMVLAGLTPLGEEYLERVKSAFAGKWIDVYENQGKTGGAYAWGAYDTHPYILLNYQGKIHDVFTIAHEMGHAMHSYSTNHTQPYVYSSYRIFLAEVASTVNEALLMQHLLAKSADRNEKLYLLNQFLEQFRTTVFRQTMFAEFERLIHTEVEQGGALTAEWFGEHYLELNNYYYGAETIIDPELKMEWSRIPHFYSGFYVYKYATGYAAAIALSQQILKEGRSAQERYLKFLSSGDADYPLNLLRQAGVDMESPLPVAAALGLFNKLLEEMAELTGVDLS